ncbi:MAG: tRNA dimethylallyltransferase [Acidimicrobiia bacterium]|nr:MAG: tRNA dimethylallyltransferase [Acidimicrobiia bacterium]
MVGPTASGKSDVGIRIAEAVGAVILSVDSMQVYRGMDIGTAKPTPEERRRVPHLMIDLVEPEVEYTVAEFQRTARELIDHADRPVLIVGGSGLHFRAVVDPLEFPPTDPEIRAELEQTPIEDLRSMLLSVDPQAARFVDLDNPRRVVRAVEVLRLTGRTPTALHSTQAARKVARYESLYDLRVVGVDAGDALAGRVSQRLSRMREMGFLDEVARLAPRLGKTASQAVGYRQLLDVVAGRRSEDEGFAAAEAATLRLARAQRTYFRRDPRIQWVEWDADPDRLAEKVRDRLGVRCGS